MLHNHNSQSNIGKEGIELGKNITLQMTKGIEELTREALIKSMETTDDNGMKELYDIYHPKTFSNKLKKFVKGFHYKMVAGRRWWNVKRITGQESMIGSQLEIFDNK